MTKKLMLINVADDESRIAIVEDSLLQEMLIEHRTKEQSKNNIYKGTVVQIQTSLQAAFVDYGNKKHGFLPASEINPTLYTKKNAGANSPIQQKLKPGQSILVQVTREAVDQKGAALSTNISIPGRFMVLMPNSNKGGVSKKIEQSEERDRLKGFLAGIESEKHAVIIRTAGLGRDLAELKKDYTSLKKTWEEIQKEFKKMKFPGLIQEEADVISRTLRDYYTEDIAEIWVDNPETFQKVLQFIKQNAPRKQKDLKLFVGERSLFSSYKVERQVEQLTSREVKLHSGGSVVIEQTEALVAIDVNSGKSNQEADIDATALRTNLEAAREIARQIRLRNLGGLIVVDFIDMETAEARKKVEEELRNSMERDRAHRKYNPISQFGLLEFSRQRLSVGISSTVESVCPTCSGKGRIPSLLASTNMIVRAIREMAAKGNLIKIEGDIPLTLANHLLNERRQSIADLELEFGIDILLRGDPTLLVFNETLLKPMYSQPSAKTAEPENEKDQPKQGSSKKKQRKKDPAPKKQSPGDQRTENTAAAKATEPKEAGAKTAETPEIIQSIEDTEMVPAAPPVEKVASPKNQKTDEANDSSIHPSCLFTDVKELESDELAEVTQSFENRLKGKVENGSQYLIDSKYLWKNGKPHSDSVETDVAPLPADDETGHEIEKEAASNNDRKAEQPDKSQLTDKPVQPEDEIDKPVQDSTGETKADPVENATAAADVESAAESSQEEPADEEKKAAKPVADMTVKPETKKTQRRRSPRKKSTKKTADKSNASETETTKNTEKEPVKAEEKPPTSPDTADAPKPEDEKKDPAKEEKPKKPRRRTKKKPQAAEKKTGETQDKPAEKKTTGKQTTSKSTKKPKDTNTAESKAEKPTKEETQSTKADKPEERKKPLGKEGNAQPAKGKRRNRKVNHCDLE